MSFKNNVLLDVPYPWQITFQDPATDIMDRMIMFHHELMMYFSLICILVFWFLVRINFLFYEGSLVGLGWYKHIPLHERKKVYVNHSTLLELFWTTLPATFVFLILIPAFGLISYSEPEAESELTIKVVGSQWYWTYEYELHASDLYLPQKSLGLEKMGFIKGLPGYLINWEWLQLKSLVVQSNRIPTADLPYGYFRLLDVDQPLFIPRHTQITLLITSTDVLHSFTVPSLGIKVDACPGRINEVSFIVYRNSVFYGQCSELCGVLHGYMPIVIISISMGDFLKILLINDPVQDTLTPEKGFQE